MRTIPLDSFLPPHLAFAKGLMAYVAPGTRIGKWRTYTMLIGGHTHYVVTFLDTVVCETTLLRVVLFCHRQAGQE